jgi:protocatechuate 3,4-dioxygenase beta subunit
MLNTNIIKTTTISTSIIVTLFFSIFSSSFSESFAQNTTTSILNNDKENEITPSCELTVPTVQGPYYKEGSPIKGSEFSKGIEGERLVVTGKILGFMKCNPLIGAVLDFWQTDSKGEYDNEGFTLRGKIISDENGNYTLNTIVPSSYSEGNTTRPAHIHVKAWIPDNPGNPALVTQLYFEGDPYMDKFVKDPLIMKIVEKNGTKYANFDFVLEDYRNFSP